MDKAKLKQFEEKFEHLFSVAWFEEIWKIEDWNLKGRIGSDRISASFQIEC